MFSLALALALPAAAAPAIGTAAGTALAGDVGAVRAAEAQRAQAVARRDVKLLRQLFGGAYYHVETNGRVRTKTEVLQLLERDEFEFSSYGMDNTEIAMLDNGHTAVVTGRLIARINGVERPKEWRGRYVRVWTLDKGAWRNTLHQSTEIRPPSLSLARTAQASAQQ